MRPSKLVFLRASKLGAMGSIALFAHFLAGCGGGASANGACGTHQYVYVGGATAVGGGAGWYGGDVGGGWYDPGDDGSSYDDENGADPGNSGSGSGADDGSGDNASGSGNDGSGDDGSGDDGSGDNGSGDDGSGDDGSGDDGTAAKKHLHLASTPSLHTSDVNSTSGCYAYTCTLVCAVGSSAERQARGASAISHDDACATAAHGVETWAHESLNQNVSACKEVSDGGASSPSNGAHAPATPSVSQSLPSAHPSRSLVSSRAPR